MKQKLFALIGVLSLSNNTFAFNTNMEALSDFAAPLVQNKTLSEPLLPFGSIVYDQASSSFVGLDSTGNWVTLGQSAASSQNEVVLDTGNGNGTSSGANSIRRFSNIELNVGTAISYADSLLNGATFTVNETGYYAISFSDSYSLAGRALGISRNSSQLTTAIQNINASDRLILNMSGAAGDFVSTSVTTYLVAGDVIRAHTDSALPTTEVPTTKFRIVKLNR